MALARGLLALLLKCGNYSVEIADCGVLGLVLYMKGKSKTAASG